MKNSIFFLAVLFIAAGCSNDDNAEKDRLPEATTIGANTAGCYMNGDLLVAKDGLADWSGTPYGITTGAGINFHPPVIGDDYFYVRIVDFKDKPTYSIWLQIDDMSQLEGNYPLGPANGMYMADGPDNAFIIAQYYDGENLSKTYYSKTNSGSISITKFDYENGIYSGSFNGTLYNVDNPDDTVVITDGRFDISISTLNRE